MRFFVLSFILCTAACARTTDNPFPDPIQATDDVVVVGLEDFATLPGIEGASARPMLLIQDPGADRMFVNDMWGILYTIADDGQVNRYLDIRDESWGMPVDAASRERGFQSFALHPQFNQLGTTGYGKLYTWSDTSDMERKPDFVPGGGRRTHHTVLLEWTAQDPAAPIYDGGPPRELLRVEQPFPNHNGGHLAFNPLALPDDPDYGLLYIGVADGGSGGDPLGLAQDPGSVFGKILRIDPLGTDSDNSQYGIPTDNPFVNDPDGARGEIYAIGLRNPQRFGWDPANGNLFVADIGQRVVEELSLVAAGANLGWNRWEGSFRYVDRSRVDLRAPRSDPDMTYPVVEYGRQDPLFQARVAITGVVVVRGARVPQLQNRILFGDMVSGEVFHISADDLPKGGQEALRRVLFRMDGRSLTYLELIQHHARTADRLPPDRADLRFGTGADGRVFLLNKHDGVIREIVPR